MLEKVTPRATVRGSRVFKTKGFHRFARRAGLDDACLLVAAIEVRNGRFEADLGGGIYKKRIARDGGGKSAGFRTVLICSNAGFTVFAHGYAKKDHANVSPEELKGLRRLAAAYRNAGVDDARRALVALEVHDGN